MQLIATTNLRGASLLGGSVETLLVLHQSLEALIAERVTEPGATSFLSQPALNEGRNQVDWFTLLDGDVRRLGELIGPEERRARERVRTIREALARLARYLTDSDDQAEQQRGKVLEAALAQGDERIYMVGDQPVLAEWGAERTAAARAPAPLVADGVVPDAGSAGTGASASAVAAGSATTLTRTTRSRGWLGWLLALLVLLALLLLLSQCTPGSVTWLDDGDTVADGLAEEAGLRRQLSQRRIRLDEERLICGECDVDPGLSPPIGPRMSGSAGPGGAEGPPPIDESELCNRISQELGECDPGDLSITLAWNALHDLDLGVEGPSGQIIYHEAREGKGGGNLAVDYNWKPEERTTEPVENVNWAGAPPPGRYRVYVNLHDIDPRQAEIDPVPFTIRITLGEQTETVTGTIAHADAGRWVLVHEFVVN